MKLCSIGIISIIPSRCDTELTIIIKIITVIIMMINIILLYVVLQVLLYVVLQVLLLCTYYYYGFIIDLL